MEEQKLVHWRVGGKIEYCGVEALENGRDVEVEIDHIDFFESKRIQGDAKSNVWVCYFKANPYTTLPMLLNSTNRKRLSKLTNTDYLQTVKNFWVRLTKEECRDPQDGGRTEGLRISKIPAKGKSTKQVELEELTPDHPNWPLCVAFLKKGGNVEEFRKKYRFGKDVEEALMAAAQTLEDMPSSGEFDEKREA